MSDVSLSGDVLVLSSCLRCDAAGAASVGFEFITLGAHQNIQKRGPRVLNQTRLGEPVQPNRSAAM